MMKTRLSRIKGYWGYHSVAFVYHSIEFQLIKGSFWLAVNKWCVCVCIWIHLRLISYISIILYVIKYIKHAIEWYLTQWNIKMLRAYAIDFNAIMQLNDIRMQHNDNDCIWIQMYVGWIVTFFKLIYYHHRYWQKNKIESTNQNLSLHM